jgi:chitin disaccharide deacetylase
MTHLQIIADDYGLSSAVNRGIEELARAGMVDGVSVMAHRDADLSTVSKLCAAPVQLGVHLVFVEERPLLSLGDDAAETRLPPTYRALFRALLRTPSLAAKLAREADAQVAVLKARGLRLSFLNSHQHVHMFPPLWRALRPLMERERLRVRVARQLRWAPPKQWLVDLAGRVSWALWPLAGCETAAPIGVELAGRFDQRGASRLGARLRRSTCTEQLELVVHPGHEDDALQHRYAHWHYHWADELRVLSAGAVRAALSSSAA